LNHAAPTAPPLLWMARLEVQVAAIVSLGAPARHGERRYVPITGGTVSGPELNGEIVEGGVDWQVLRADGVLDIAAHYVLRLADGALVEVQSDGLRHGAAPQPVYFRTAVRFTTGHPAWLHLNKLLAVATGERLPDRVLLDFWKLARTTAGASPHPGCGSAAHARRS
jgi:Protein of unknown function (DUF3237)